MKIKKINVFQVGLPLKEGSYKWSGGKSVDVFDCTVVAIETDAGLTGFGEVCPLGPAYLPAYGSGVRAGLAELGPHLLGQDPTAIECLNRLMDRQLKGHPYVKSAIDMACWDLIGKQAQLPVSTLLGGTFGEDFVLYRAISQQSPEEMTANIDSYRQEGYRRFQLKVGGNPDVDIERIRMVANEMQPGEKLVADANTGWTQHEAIRVVRAVDDLDVYIEQPCELYESCLQVRRRSTQPFVMDENVDSVSMLVRALADQAMDVVNLKISKFGGISKLRKARDLCVEMGIAMTIEDSWGGDIITSAIAHLAHSTPPELLFSSTDFNSYVTVQTATGGPQRSNGSLKSSDQPGLGIEPCWDLMGEPVLSI